MSPLVFASRSAVFPVFSMVSKTCLLLMFNFNYMQYTHIFERFNISIDLSAPGYDLVQVGLVCVVAGSGWGEGRCVCGVAAFTPGGLALKITAGKTGFGREWGRDPRVARCNAVLIRMLPGCYFRSVIFPACSLVERQREVMRCA